jgi:hypothetical protein
MQVEATTQKKFKALPFRVKVQGLALMPGNVLVEAIVLRVMSFFRVKT